MGAEDVLCHGETVSAGTCVHACRGCSKHVRGRRRLRGGISGNTFMQDKEEAELSEL